MFAHAVAIEKLGQRQAVGKLVVLMH